MNVVRSFIVRNPKTSIFLLIFAIISLSSFSLYMYNELMEKLPKPIEEEGEPLAEIAVITRKSGELPPGSEKIPEMVFYYEFGSPSEPMVLWQFDLVRRTIVCECDRRYEWSISRSGPEYSCSQMTDSKRIEEILSRISRTDFSVFRKRYRPAYPIHDGTFWKLRIRFADGRCQEWTGNNAWPKNPSLPFDGLGGKYKETNQYSAPIDPLVRDLYDPGLFVRRKSNKKKGL